MLTGKIAKKVVRKAGRKVVRKVTDEVTERIAEKAADALLKQGRRMIRKYSAAGLIRKLV